MLTIKHVNYGNRTVVEAERVKFHMPTKKTEELLAQPAVVEVFHSGTIGVSLFVEGTVYVMNDKGRTIDTIDLDLENAEPSDPPVENAYRIGEHAEADCRLRPLPA